jgi:glycosyltransferase involved in cell wall biosynthesis
MSKKISIIIPAYNAESTIKKCIDSLINQTYKNIEIIIINDGSNDKTSDVLEEYEQKDERIKVINNENHGVSFSRNMGIDLADGDYITFVDSDDYLDVNCFEKIIQKMPEDVDILRYNFKIDGIQKYSNNLFDLKNKIIEINEQTKMNLYRHFLTFNEPIPNFVMLLLIKKEIAKTTKFHENLTMMEDVHYYLQLFQKAKNIYFLDEKMYNYYINPSSVTNCCKNYMKNALGILNTNVCINSLLEEEKVDKLREKINSNHLRIISQFVINSYRQDKKECLKIIKELNKSKIFNDLKIYCKQTPFKNKVLLSLIYKKKYLLCKWYCKILDRLYIIKGK